MKTVSQVLRRATIFVAILSMVIGLLPPSLALAATGPDPNRPLAPTGVFSLTKSANPTGNVYPEGTLTYTLVVQNNGNPSQAFLSDPLPPETSFAGGAVSASAGTAYYEPAGKRIVWSKDPLAAGESVTISFPVKVNTGLSAGTLITNTATLYDQNPDAGGQALNTATYVNTIVSPLTVTKSAPAEAVITPSKPNADITYAITVENNGPETVMASVIDSAPTATTFVTATAPAGTFTQRDNAGIAWNYAMPSGKSVVITYKVNTGGNTKTGTPIVNTATVTNNKLPGIQSGGPVTTTVVGPIKAVKTVDKSSAYPGEELAYVITLENISSAAVGVRFTDTLPAELNPATFVNMGGGNWDGATVKFNGSLAAGGKQTISFKVKIGTTLPPGTKAVDNVSQVYDSIDEFSVNAKTNIKSLLDASTKTAAPEPVQAGQLVTYSISLVNNSGTVDAKNTVFSDPVPANTSYVTATVTPGHGVLTANAGGISWTGTVSKSVPVNFTYAVMVDSPLDRRYGFCVHYEGGSLHGRQCAGSDQVCQGGGWHHHASTGRYGQLQNHLEEHGQHDRP
jgi:uncharacterized repeat protein (TIGR01451 family)